MNSAFDFRVYHVTNIDLRNDPEWVYSRTDLYMNIGDLQ